MFGGDLKTKITANLKDLRHDVSNNINKIVGELLYINFHIPWLVSDILLDKRNSCLSQDLLRIRSRGRRQYQKYPSSIERNRNTMVPKNIFFISCSIWNDQCGAGLRFYR